MSMKIPEGARAVPRQPQDLSECYIQNPNVGSDFLTKEEALDAICMLAGQLMIDLKREQSKSERMIDGQRG